MKKKIRSKTVYTKSPGNYHMNKILEKKSNFLSIGEKHANDEGARRVYHVFQVLRYKTRKMSILLTVKISFKSKGGTQVLKF